MSSSAGRNSGTTTTAPFSPSTTESSSEFSNFQFNTANRNSAGRNYFSLSVIDHRRAGGRTAAQPPPPRRDDRQDEEEDGRQGDRTRDRSVEENSQRPLRHDEALTQRVFGEIAEDERQHERRERIVELLEGVADDAEYHHVPAVDHAVVHGVGADRAHDHDERRQNRERDAQNRREERHEREHHQHADDVAGVHAGDEAPDKVGLFLEQQRPGLQPPDDEPADQAAS